MPKYVYQDRGYIRFIRRARGLSVMMKEEPGTPEFWDHYNRLLKARDPIPAKRSFETLILRYYESDAFRRLKPRTKADYRKYINHICKIWGAKDPAKIKLIIFTNCTATTLTAGGKPIIWFRLWWF